MSRRVLADRMRVTVQTIYNWEHDTNIPGADDLDRLIEVLGKPMNYFFGPMNAKG